MDGTIMSGPYALGMAIPVYTPPPTVDNPNPKEVVDYEKWAAITEQGNKADGGNFFTHVDDAVNDLPGGWALPIAVAVAMYTGYVDPSLLAAEAGAEAAGTTAFAGASETGLGTLAGEGAVGDVAGNTLLSGTGATEAAVSSALPEATVEGTYQMGQGTSLSADASTNPLNPFYNTANPEVSANFNTVSNLVGGGAESNLTALNQLASNPLLPIGSGGIGGAELGSVGSIIGSGQGLGQQTLAQVLAPTGLSGVSVQDLASENPVYSSNTNVKDALRAANQLRKLLTPQQQTQQRTALQNAQNTQQQSNMANMLRGTQMAQTPLPAIYKQANPFNFGQQNQPVQDRKSTRLNSSH
jgi:hypothetical protein